jgi:hypothetical protein
VSRNRGAAGPQPPHVIVTPGIDHRPRTAAERSQRPQRKERTMTIDHATLDQDRVQEFQGLAVA